MSSQVEIYRISPDCQVCGVDISAGREVYNRSRRVCGDCNKSLIEMTEAKRQARMFRGPNRVKRERVK